MIASGSELSLAVDAHETLLAEGVKSRVVSMPLWELFDHQPQEYAIASHPQHQPRVLHLNKRRGWVGKKCRNVQHHQDAHIRSLGTLEGTTAKFGFEPELVAAGARDELRRNRPIKPTVVNR
jgi:transketolase